MWFQNACCDEKNVDLKGKDFMTLACEFGLMTLNATKMSAYSATDRTLACASRRAFAILKRKCNSQRVGLKCDDVSAYEDAKRCSFKALELPCQMKGFGQSGCDRKYVGLGLMKGLCAFVGKGFVTLPSGRRAFSCDEDVLCASMGQVEARQRSWLMPPHGGRNVCLVRRALYCLTERALKCDDVSA
jgi:hypothetical protein